MLIFEQSRVGRHASAQTPETSSNALQIPEALERKTKLGLPEASELDVIRHYTRLSQKNFSIDTNFYPLGSCTMKYNPRVCNSLALNDGFLNAHPHTPDEHIQGTLSCMFHLQEILQEVTGMKAVSLTPMAGAQGEFSGIAMIKAYHDDRQDFERNEIIVPDAAHGTNPATAIMCGYKVVEIRTNRDGNINLHDLEPLLSEKTAGIMLTNPSTLGVFEPNIKEIANMVHEAGGLLYYDGANLNAILGKVRPGDMDFDVIHMNLHKTFSTPHGGGGPGSGAIGVGRRLVPYMPTPFVAKSEHGYHYVDEKQAPKSIGKLSAFAGNVGVNLRAYIYALLLGKQGMPRIAEFATLNANYLMKQLEKVGFELAFPKRRASHEFIVTLKKQSKDLNLTATDVAKRLLDYGMHAPTIYFPLLVAECMLIEPTETESKQTIDRFVEAMSDILKQAESDIETIKQAPHTAPNRRLDDAKAVKQPNLVWRNPAQ